MNLGTHIILNPAGTYSFVGTLPVVLATKVPATKSDVMGGRAFFDEDRSLATWKFPVFATRELALQFAADRGVTVRE